MLIDCLIHQASRFKKMGGNPELISSVSVVAALTLTFPVNGPLVTGSMVMLLVPGNSTGKNVFAFELSAPNVFK